MIKRNTLILVLLTVLTLPVVAHAAPCYFLAVPTLEVVGPFAAREWCLTTLADLEEAFGSTTQHPTVTVGPWETPAGPHWQFIATPTIGWVGPFADKVTCDHVRDVLAHLYGLSPSHVTTSCVPSE